jgi:PII-like signaling protein
MPVPSVARSATTAGAVRAIGAPETLRTKTLFSTSPSLPGEIAIESPETKIAAFIPVGTETLRTLK